MLLRRMTENLRTQNWLAVALDFLIVVLGVFLGVQLGNWNDASQDNRSERAVLLQLHEEIVSAQSIFDDSRVYDPDVLPNIQTFVNAFYHGEGELTEELICTAAGVSTVMPNVIGKLSSVEELIATGRLSRLSDPELRQAIGDFHEMTTINETRIVDYRTVAVSLQKEFSEHFSLIPYIDESDGEVRLGGECDAAAMREDQVFRNTLARNLDIYDSWYRRFVLQPKDSLERLHHDTDKALGLSHEGDAG